MVSCLPDIAIAVVDLLQEMTDVESLTESDSDGANLLIDSLVRMTFNSLGIK